MRRIVKLFLFFFSSLAFLVLLAVFKLIWLVVRIGERKIQTRMTQVWARLMLFIVGIRVEPLFHPNIRKDKNYLVVGNHQSYLDIIIIASIFPALFVAKKEVKGWPLIGWLAALGGTIFIDRKSFRGGVHSGNEVAEALRSGVNVQIFPEGTSTNGTTVLPFKPSLIKPAVDTQTMILPITINYLLLNGHSLSLKGRDTLCWYGEMDFVNHFWKLLEQGSIVVSLTTHQAVTSYAFDSIKELADHVHSDVSSGLFSRSVGEVRPVRGYEEYSIAQN